MTVMKMPNSLIRFEAFLREAEHHANKRPWFNTNFFISLIFYSAIITSWLLLVSVPQTKFRIFLVFGIPFWLAWILYDSLEKRRVLKASRQDPLQATYIELIDELKKYSENRSLGERLHPAVSRRVESVADSFFRVRTWLREPSSKNVLGIQLHADVMQATDRAMREVIFSVHGAYRPTGMQRKQWQKMVESDPDALETCDNLTKINSLLEQLTEIMGKVESFGMTITLTDQLRAVSEAIEEMEQNSFANLKSLPAPKQSEETSVQG